jgi:hypothetical protein
MPCDVFCRPWLKAKESSTIVRMRSSAARDSKDLDKRSILVQKTGRFKTHNLLTISTGLRGPSHVAWSLVRDLVEQAIDVDLDTILICAPGHSVAEDVGVTEGVCETLLGRFAQYPRGLFMLPEELCFVLLLRHRLTQRSRALECAVAALLTPIVEAAVGRDGGSCSLRVERCTVATAVAIAVEQIILLCTQIDTRACQNVANIIHVQITRVRLFQLSVICSLAVWNLWRRHRTRRRRLLRLLLLRHSIRMLIGLGLVKRRRLRIGGRLR